MACTDAEPTKDAIGYVNKKTDKLYKNTMVEMAFETTNISGKTDGNANSIAIQTIQTRDATTNGAIESGTQTETMNVLKTFNCTREITTRRIIAAHCPNTIGNQDKYARIIQKCMRMWMDRIKFERMLKYYYYLKHLACGEEKIIRNIIYINEQRNLINLQYPTKTKDFEALYYAIYRHHAKNKTENKVRLKDELKCLEEISKHRNQVNAIAKEEKIFRWLNEMSKPIEVRRKNGGIIVVETPETYQAKRLMEFYMSLKRRDGNKIERTNLLIKLMKLLECYDQIELTKTILNLVNRELTLMKVDQINGNQLETLRKRIEIEFQWIIKQPELNPASMSISSKFMIVVKCFNCRNLKSLNTFKIKMDCLKATTCKDCAHLHRITTERIDLIPYEDIFKTIKATEVKLCAKSNFTFFLNAVDIYYLVMMVWKGKSAIDESKDIMRLRLVRWNNKLDWSPANTILLTIEEAYIHSKISDMNQVFTSSFIDDVHLKHMIAKKYFKVLSRISMDCDRTMAIVRNDARS